MQIMDGHVHSHFSDDCSEHPDNQLQAAVSRGLAGIAITDHCDLVRYNKAGYADSVAASAKYTHAAKMRYAGSLELLTGVELGDILDHPEDAKKVLSQGNYDMVLGSIHWGPAGEDIYYNQFQNWSSSEIHAYLLWYFRYLLRLAASPYCDVIAHFTYPLRYIVGKCGVPVDMRPYADLIDQVLEVMIQEGKGLEINTAGLRQEVRDTAPPLWMLERYKQLGGVYVTIGSDAHKKENVGDGLDTAIQILQRTGYEAYTIFQNRKPRQIGITNITEE